MRLPAGSARTSATRTRRSIDPAARSESDHGDRGDGHERRTRPGRPDVTGGTADEPKKKRGFWSRVFGGKKDDQKDEKKDKKDKKPDGDP